MSCELYFRAPIRRSGWAVLSPLPSPTLASFAARHILRLGQARALAAAISRACRLGLLRSIQHHLQPRHHAAQRTTCSQCKDRCFRRLSSFSRLSQRPDDRRPRAMATLLAELPVQAILEPLRAPSTPSFALGATIWQVSIPISVHCNHDNHDNHAPACRIADI